MPTTSIRFSACVFSALAVAACSGSPAPDDVTREQLPSGAERITWHQLPPTLLAIDTVAVWHPWQDHPGYEFGDVRSVSGARAGARLRPQG